MRPAMGSVRLFKGLGILGDEKNAFQFLQLLLGLITSMPTTVNLAPENENRNRYESISAVPYRRLRRRSYNQA
jgi:hypothetical protein